MVKYNRSINFGGTVYIFVRIMSNLFLSYVDKVNVFMIKYMCMDQKERRQSVFHFWSFVRKERRKLF